MSADVSSGDAHYAAMYKLIYKNEKMSKQEIAQQMNLSLPTVTQTLHRLLTDEQIVTDGKFTSQVGRRAVVYSPNSDHLYAIGLEMFADHVTLSLLNVLYEDLGSDTMTIQFSPDPLYFEQLGDWLNHFIDRYKLDRNRIVGVGVGIQGLISPDGKTVLYGKILNCTGLKSSQFEAAFDLPVTLYHDADCVAMAEQTLSGDHRDAIYLSIGEHLGTAIVINDHIYTGENGRSGTMEHITLNPRSGKECYCGRKGCLETYSSLSALLHDGETMSAFTLKVTQGDSAALSRWHQYLGDLAEVINNLHMFVDNRLVIAGDIVKYLNKDVVETLNTQIKDITAFPEDQRYVELGTVRNRAVSLGAGIPLIFKELDRMK